MTAAKCGLIASCAVALTFLGTGCTVIFDPDTNVCDTNDDCTEDATGVANLVCENNLCVESIEGTFNCVGTTRNVMANSAPFTFTAQLNNGSSPGAIDTTATANLCGTLDSACSNPIEGPVDSDAGGAVTFETTQGIREQSYGEAEAEGYTPIAWMMNRGIDVATNEASYSMFRDGEIGVLASLAGAAYDPNFGFIIATAFLCTDSELATPEERARFRATGVTFRLDTVDRSTIQYYIRGGISGAPSTSANETDASGNGGFINAPVGFLTVRALVDGEQVGEAAVVTRPGWISFVSLYPTRTLVPADD